MYRCHVSCLTLLSLTCVIEGFSTVEMCRLLLQLRAEIQALFRALLHITCCSNSIYHIVISPSLHSAFFRQCLHAIRRFDHDQSGINTLDIGLNQVRKDCGRVYFSLQVFFDRIPAFLPKRIIINMQKS